MKMAGDLKIVARIVTGGITVLDVAGDLDVAVLPVLNEKVEGVVRLGGAKLIVNCAKVGYINSTAIAFLVQKMKKIQRRGGAFALCGLSSYNNTVMKLTGASKRMPIYPAEDEAVKALVAKQ
jgi:anti-sigma B factor antagonist